jgi:hypothetical protein
MPAKKTSAKPADTLKENVAKRAVQEVKKAPQKIVEHTLNAALNAVEKAAVQDVKRKAKRVERTAKKVAKKKQDIMAQKTAARTKSSLNNEGVAIAVNTPAPASAPTPQKTVKTQSKVNLKTKIKEKIKELITPEKEQIFYYDRRQQVALMLFYAIIALIVYGIKEMLKFYPSCCNDYLLIALNITEVLIIAAFALTLIVIIFKPTLAIVNKDGIKIDHNQTLSWDDVELAEEKYTSYITRRPLIALHVTPDNLKKYRLTFMQVLCKNNVFTPFSIPMYAMHPKDAEAIRNAIKRHTKYVDNRN